MGTPERQQILVVEDDQSLTKFLEVLLASSGYDVQVTDTGHGALEAVKAHQPQLVMLDLRLPDMSGYDVCKQLRQEFHPWAMPILMLTAMNTPADELRGYANGADAYVTKPCEPPELLHTITLLLGDTASWHGTAGSA